MCALWPWHWRYDLLVFKGPNMSLGHGQQLCEKLSRSNLTVWMLWPIHGFWVCVYCDIDLGNMTLHQGHDTPLGHENNCVKYRYYPDLTWQWGVMARTQILGMCVLCPWPWRYMYDLGSRSWHSLGSWTTTLWNFIQIQHDSEKLWPGHRFWA